MSVNRFITPICNNGVITGEGLNARAVGLWADKVDMQIASLTDNLDNLVSVVREMAENLQVHSKSNLDLLNRVSALEAEIAELRGGSHEAVTDK